METDHGAKSVGNLARCHRLVAVLRPIELHCVSRRGHKESRRLFSLSAHVIRDLLDRVERIELAAHAEGHFGHTRRFTGK